VADTGIGIPEADRQNIFDRFYRVDKARSRASGGSGLGLAIVHDAVVANDGTIDVARREPKGTVFTVTFPLSRKKVKRP
jgi:two-component system sensor histidine kinase CiaH